MTLKVGIAPFTRVAANTIIPEQQDGVSSTETGLTVKISFKNPQVMTQRFQLEIIGKDSTEDEGSLLNTITFSASIVQPSGYTITRITSSDLRNPA